MVTVIPVVVTAYAQRATWELLVMKLLLLVPAIVLTTEPAQYTPGYAFATPTTGELTAASKCAPRTTFLIALAKVFATQLLAHAIAIQAGLEVPARNQSNLVLTAVMDMDIVILRQVFAPATR